MVVLGLESCNVDKSAGAMQRQYFKGFLFHLPSMVPWTFLRYRPAAKVGTEETAE